MTSTPMAVLVEEECGARGQLSSEHESIASGKRLGKKTNSSACYYIDI